MELSRQLTTEDGRYEAREQAFWLPLTAKVMTSPTRAVRRPELIEISFMSDIDVYDAAKPCPQTILYLGSSSMV